MGNEISGEIAKTDICNVGEPAEDIRKSLKIIYKEFSEKTGCLAKKSLFFLRLIFACRFLFKICV